jgi:hypothetical protein
MDVQCRGVHDRPPLLSKLLSFHVRGLQLLLHGWMLDVGEATEVPPSTPVAS